MAELFFRDAQALLRILVVGISAYICLILLLRISGKRTLSKMNAFDFVVTVALGSTLATILLSKDVTLAQGVVAFAVLIGAQYIVTWTSVRYEWICGVVTGEPLMLAYQGQLLPQAMKKARVTESEITAAFGHKVCLACRRRRLWCWKPTAHSVCCRIEKRHTLALRT